MMKREHKKSFVMRLILKAHSGNLQSFILFCGIAIELII